jgi:hypothetical protein
MKADVVVLIFAHAPELQWHEKISLEQCLRVLGQHAVRLVCPEGLDVSAYLRIAPALQVDFIPSQWMASYRAYNRLRVLPLLYKRYAAFEYILFHELDAFVFRDELSDWCAQGWDTIGAPWFERHHEALPDAAPTGAGNGGLCLRRTKSMLRVLHSFGHVIPARTVLDDWRRARSFSPGSLWLLFSRLTYRNNFFWLLNDFGANDDIFWGKYAAKRFPWFRIAPYGVAERFSFEVNAPRLYREIGNRLPFGCHKWQQLTPDFWFPIIRSLGYSVPEAPSLPLGARGR